MGNRLKMPIINEPTYEGFTVTDENYNAVTGLTSASIDVNLFDPSNNEVSSTIPVFIIDIGNGSYNLSFTPNEIGNWYLVIYHPVYFPWGKSNTITVYNESIDTLPISIWSQETSGYNQGTFGDALETILNIETGRWKIVNSQMIFYKPDNITEIMRFDLKNPKGNPAVENVVDRIKI